VRAAPDGDLQQRLEAVKELIAIFKLERTVYLVISALSFVVLLITAVFVLQRGGVAASGQVLALFGSSGAIGFTGGRLLKMWSDALAFINSLVAKENENG
jgi:hypothetical protein